MMERKNLELLRILVTLLALGGLGIMSYLTYLHYSGVQSFCDISEEVSCDVVTTSIYSEIFGIPMALLGLGYFITVLALLWWKRKPETYLVIFLLTLFALIPSLYLSFLELFVIKALCVLCELSKVLMFVILALSFFGVKTKARLPFSLNTVAPVIIAGLLATGITYFAQTGTVVAEDHSELVACLNEKGVVYYKSVKCNNCIRQERLFGEAIANLNSVECHPEGENPQPALCLAKKIDKTPTFLIEQDGVEVKRIEGLQKLEVLAEFAGCPFGAP